MCLQLFLKLQNVLVLQAPSPTYPDSSYSIQHLEHSHYPPAEASEILQWIIIVNTPLRFDFQLVGSILNPQKDTVLIKGAHSFVTKPAKTSAFWESKGKFELEVSNRRVLERW